MSTYNLSCNFPVWPLFTFKTPFSEQLATNLLRGSTWGPSLVEGPLTPSLLPWQRIQETSTLWLLLICRAALDQMGRVQSTRCIVTVAEMYQENSNYRGSQKRCRPLSRRGWLPAGAMFAPSTVTPVSWDNRNGEWEQGRATLGRSASIQGGRETKG